ncbi:Protein kinase-like domain-containing protein [Rhodotorula toruloides]|uniref:Protein kinase-like domain-containing protein n=1 Tax=Rhodotorula toruloides TaxID=5286 RepID=A0A2T0A0W9_RHOTO|nr:Protein kinase-like domain-containing protein [Rhodotorula toruloides]
MKLDGRWLTFPTVPAVASTDPSSPSKRPRRFINERNRPLAPSSAAVEEDLPPPNWIKTNGDSLTEEDRNYVKRVIWRGRRFIVKYGWCVRQQEADIMRFVRANTNVPVPEVFAVKVYEKQVFIYMEDVEGSTMHDCDESTRRMVAPQILAHIQQLRQLRMPSQGQIGDFPAPTYRNLKRAILGCTPSSKYSQMPAVDTTADFQRWLAVEVAPRIRMFPSVETRKRLVPHVESLDASAPVVFTHGDLHSGNILVRDGRVVGIIDWEMGGWYPEWVEAEIVGYYRDTGDERAAEVAAVLGLAEEKERWKSRHLWIHALRIA